MNIDICTAIALLPLTYIIIFIEFVQNEYRYLYCDSIISIPLY